MGGVREDFAAEGQSGSDAGRRSETSAATMWSMASRGRRAALGSDKATGAKRDLSNGAHPMKRTAPWEGRAPSRPRQMTGASREPESFAESSSGAPIT